MQRALALDASPPLSFSLRFFLSAPLFVLLAALLLIAYGPQALNSRWQPAVLAITHLLVLGTLAQTMMGALLQILPVATGIAVFHSNLLVSFIYASLNIGTILLAGAFLSALPGLFAAASILLALAFGAFMLALAWGLWRDRHQQTKGAPTILMAVRLALVALVITVVLGLFLSSHMVFGWPLHRWLTNLHAGWGLFGWVGLLVIGISYQVIPIFQVTERFPDQMTGFWAPLIFILILLLSAGLHYAQPLIGGLSTALLLLALAAYAMTALKLLRHRKRPYPDTTTLFWFTAFASLLLCLPVWAALTLVPAGNLLGASDSATILRLLPVLLGLLAIYGFAWSAINGMLYTILPFLLWYNAQRHAPIVIRALPKVRHYLPDAQARPQFYCHLLSVFCLTGAVFWPVALLPIAALTMILSVLWLYKNMLAALRHYQQALALIQRTVQQKNQ